MFRKSFFPNILAIFFSTIVAASCSSSSTDYDATGTFETTEVTVSAEQNGRLLQFSLTEGDSIKAGQQVALIDTVQLYLKARQIGATRLVYANQRPDIQKQIAATRQQLAKAEQELQRYTALAADGAANRKLQDDAQSQVAVLRRQLEAQLSSLRTSTSSLDAQMGTADVQQLQVADQLLKCHVASPIDGVVLEKYVEQGEFASIGKPLFKVADTHKMYLRAYVTTAQLAKVAVGKQVKVFADYGNSNRKEYKGSVCWISQKAEFTPKTVLTDDERADLVYAVKVFVENDGGIKMGMYGEVAF